MASKIKRLAKSDSITTPMKKNSILVVDDDEDIAMFLKKGLEREGFNVDAYIDPQIALAKFKAETYELMLLDIRMPGMTGFELYTKLMRIDDKAKVCFLTAFETYRYEFKKHFPSLDEVKCYIKKPITISDLVRRLKPMFESM